MLKEFTPIERDLDDPRFGTIDLLRHRDSNALCFSKRVQSESAETHQQAAASAEDRLRLNHENLIDFKGFYPDHRSLQLFLVFGYPDRDLWDEGGRFERVEELMRLVNDGLEALSHLELHGLCHGGVRPEAMFYDDGEDKFVLLDRLADPSPPRLDSTKMSDCFGLGLTVAALALGQGQTHELATLDVAGIAKIREDFRTLCEQKNFAEFGEFIAGRLLASPEARPGPTRALYEFLGKFESRLRPRRSTAGEKLKSWGVETAETGGGERESIEDDQDRFWPIVAEQLMARGLRLIPAEPEGPEEPEIGLPDSARFVDEAAEEPRTSLRTLMAAGYRLLPPPTEEEPEIGLPDSARFIDEVVEEQPLITAKELLAHGFKIIPPEPIPTITLPDSAKFIDESLPEEPVNRVEPPPPVVSVDSGLQVSDRTVQLNAISHLEAKGFRVLPPRASNEGINESSAKTVVIPFKPVKLDADTSTRSLEHKESGVRKPPLKIETNSNSYSHKKLRKTNQLEPGRLMFQQEKKPALITEIGVNTDELSVKDSSAHPIDTQYSNFAVKDSYVELDPYSSFKPGALDPYHVDHPYASLQPSDLAPHSQHFVDETQELFKKINDQLKKSERLIIENQTAPEIISLPRKHICPKRMNASVRSSTELKQLKPKLGTYQPGYSQVSFCTDGKNVQTFNVPEGATIRIQAPVIETLLDGPSPSPRVFKGSCLGSTMLKETAISLFSSNLKQSLPQEAVKVYSKTSQRNIAPPTIYSSHILPFDSSNKFVGVVHHRVDSNSSSASSDLLKADPKNYFSKESTHEPPLAAKTAPPAKAVTFVNAAFAKKTQIQSYRV